jgi:hypothetical protein
MLLYMFFDTVHALFAEMYDFFENKYLSQKLWNNVTARTKFQMLSIERSMCVFSKCMPCGLCQSCSAKKKSWSGQSIKAEIDPLFGPGFNDAERAHLVDRELTVVSIIHHS